LSGNEFDPRLPCALAAHVAEPLCARLGDLSESNRILIAMIRKLKSGQFRLYSRKKNAQTGKRRNLGTFATLDQARQHEREVQYFKRH
jgi:hypothetical protein